VHRGTTAPSHRRTPMVCVPRVSVPNRICTFGRCPCGSRGGDTQPGAGFTTWKGPTSAHKHGGRRRRPVPTTHQRQTPPPLCARQLGSRHGMAAGSGAGGAWRQPGRGACTRTERAEPESPPAQFGRVSGASHSRHRGDGPVCCRAHNRSLVKVCVGVLSTFVKRHNM